MENRKPFQLKNTLIVYNFVQVVFSAWLFYEVHCHQTAQLQRSRTTATEND